MDELNKWLIRSVENILSTKYLSSEEKLDAMEVSYNYYHNIKVYMIIAENRINED